MGLAPAHFFNVTREDWLEDLRRVAREMKTSRLRHATYRKCGKYPGAVHRLFGSWRAACDAAGLRPIRLRPANDQELFDNLQAVWQTLGRQPRQVEILSPISKFSVRCYVKRFGNFRKALLAFEQSRSPQGTLHRRIDPLPQQVVTGRRTSRAINWRLRFLILRRDRFRCVACGRSPATHRNVHLQVDHIKPWRDGGETVPENLQALCQTCNGGKSDLPWVGNEV